MPPRRTKRGRPTNASIERRRQEEEEQARQNPDGNSDQRPRRRRRNNRPSPVIDRIEDMQNSSQAETDGQPIVEDVITSQPDRRGPGAGDLRHTINQQTGVSVHHRTGNASTSQVVAIQQDIVALRDDNQAIQQQLANLQAQIAENQPQTLKF